MSMQTGTSTGSVAGLSGPVVLTGVVPGYAVIPATTPLTFLNYYDGKFLRASDLTQEQLALRSLVGLSNQAAATPGVTYGFDVAISSGDLLNLSPGLAIDPQGDVLFLPTSVQVSVSDLLASMQPGSSAGTTTGSGSGSSSASASFAPCDLATAPPVVNPVGSADLYLVTLSSAEGLCGSDEVFGRLCDAACVTAADRPWRIEGVLLGLVPLSLGALPTSASVVLSNLHLRSRVAAAYFAAEQASGGSLVSAAGLGSTLWCLGATAVAGSSVYLGVLARSGTTTQFLDEWTARRERIEASPQRYWAGRMAMRPWNVFLAQILQFQCQLSEVLGGRDITIVRQDPCDAAISLLGQSSALIDQIRTVVAGAPSPTTPSTEAGSAAAGGAAAAAGGGAAAAGGAAASAGGGTGGAAGGGTGGAAGQASGVGGVSTGGAGGGSSGTPEASEPGSPEISLPPDLLQRIGQFQQDVGNVIAGRTAASTHVLIDGGIVELPPAGFLPVDTSGQVALEAQVSDLLGAGVELNFCVMRHDEAGFQLTRAQHLDRISLLTGLDDATQRQQVDIFVPDGTLLAPALVAPTSSLGTNSQSTAPPAQSTGASGSQAAASSSGPAASSGTSGPAGAPASGVQSSAGVSRILLRLPPDLQAIQPSLDWVLFRRRSPIDCAPALQSVDLWVATPTGAVDVTEVPPPTSGATFAAAPYRFTSLGSVEFAGATADLVTTAASIQQAWTAGGFGTSVLRAVYTPVLAQYDALAVERCEHVVAALAPAATPAATAQYLGVASGAPEPLAFGSVGAIYLVVAPVVQSLTLGVYTVTSTSEELAIFWRQLIDNKPPDTGWTYSQAVVTPGNTSSLQSWSNQPTLAPGDTVLYGAYAPTSLQDGAADVQALVVALSTTGASTLLQTPFGMTNPPHQPQTGEDGTAYLLIAPTEATSQPSDEPVASAPEPTAKQTTEPAPEPDAAPRQQSTGRRGAARRAKPATPAPPQPNG